LRQFVYRRNELEAPLLVLSDFVIFGVCQALSIPLNLTSSFNGKAASTGVDDPLADFDGSGRAYPVQYLPKAGTNFTYVGMDFVMTPFDDPTAMDFMKSNSQTIDFNDAGVPVKRYQALHALAASIWNPSSYAQARPGNLTLHFTDGTTQQTGIIVGPWFSDSPFNGPIHTF